MSAKHRVRLSNEERTALIERTTSGRAPARTITRARILLKADESADGDAWTDQQIAAALDVGTATVERVRKRYHELRRAYPGEEIVLVLDRAGAHVSGGVTWPEGTGPFYLPPRSPELDPAERWFRELRGSLSNAAHQTLEELADALTVALRPWWKGYVLWTPETRAPSS